MSIAEQIAEHVRGLTPAQQQSVLSYARAVGSEPPAALPPGAKLDDLLAFAGTIPAAELKRMEAAIEEAFEQVRADEW